MHTGFVGKALLLNLAGTQHPLADGHTAFRRSGVGKFIKWHRSDFHLDINAVKQGSADLVEIFLHL